jgi:DNA-binding CsgD family transcriptional regulator/energy-coupling factor transporter ATP-binding protein EcfA2
LRPAAYALAMSPEIFGRDAELAEIRAFLAGLRQSAAALVLAGPPGSGKTTLLRATAELAREQGYLVLLTTPARSEVRLAFAGLGDLLDGQPSTVIEELPPPQARALRVALLAEGPPAHPPSERLIAVAFRSAIQALAARAPVLLVIDDVQWLDQPSETAVGFAVRRLQDEAVGLVCAQRTGRPGAELPLELAHGRIMTRLLPVGPLSIGALHRMLRTRLGSSLSQPMLRRIEAGSACNPFIALELGLALARRGITSAANAVLPVPDTLSGLVDEHLGDLPRQVIETVQVVAVMPDAVPENCLAAGVSAAGLDAAVATGVLELDGGRLRFSHPLFAAAVAAKIAPVRLRELHAAAAQVAERAEARARHRALAATGASDSAAQAAAARGAPATAAELFELAASLTPSDQPADGARRRLEMARHLNIGGEIRAARTTLAILIEAIPPGPTRAEALSLLAMLQQDDFPAATELLLQALAEAGGDPSLTVDIRLRLSEIWMLRGDRLGARDEARRSVADAERSCDGALLACALAQAFETDIMCGTEADERELVRALELERSDGSSPLHISPMQVAGVIYFIHGRLEEAESAQRQLLARAEADGNEQGRAEALLRLSRIAGRRGDAEMAAELGADGLEIAEQLDLPRPVVSSLYGCASAALLLGQAAKVRELAGRGSELAERTGDRPYVIFHEALLGSLDLALGEYAAAAARLVPLARTLPGVGWHPTTQSIAPDVAEALIASGELAEADEFLSTFQRAMPDPLTEALSTRCWGLLAAARGDLTAAVTALTEALTMLDRFSPHPLERARTLLGLGAVQLRLKRRSQARVTLSEALEICSRVGAALWADRARAELGRISGRAPGVADLTPAEVRVAELVASGRTNKEAAAELFVSVRAVESALTKTYAKLGVRSRAELAARLRLSGTMAPFPVGGSASAWTDSR